MKALFYLTKQCLYPKVTVQITH